VRSRRARQPSQFRIEFDRCDLALQLASVTERDCKLFLKLANVGLEFEARGAIMDVENDEQAERCRNNESDPAEHDRLGHDTTFCDTSL